MLLSAILTSALMGAPVGESITLQVDGVARTALVYRPATSTKRPVPVIFAFHGHGGNSRNAARSFALFSAWPDAMVVYPQGLPTPGKLVDPEGLKNGWQNLKGQQNDRDLHFFDALLAWTKKYESVDRHRIYAMGHSNGGGFTYLIWRTHPEVFAAFAPAGAFTGDVSALKPKPLIHIAGETDPLVKFTYQKRTVDQVLTLNRCAETSSVFDPYCQLYSGKDGNDVAFYVHPGGHGYPRDATLSIIKFFKQHRLK